MTQYKLPFLNPVNLKQENFTVVLLGETWAERTQDEENRELLMVDGAKNVIGTAQVMDALVCKLVNVPAISLEAHHDPVCRTWSGMAQVLAGGTEEVVEFDTLVTVLRLKYTGSLVKLA